MTTTITSLIEFLLALLDDDELAAEFRANPEDVLTRYGLDNACGIDIRDAQPMLADHVGVRASNGGPHFTNGEDPVSEITVLTKSYVVHMAPNTNEYNYYYIDDNDIIIVVDDRDTVHIEASGDVTIEDSFNQDNDVTVIVDSFNQDNDGVDNKGGSIDDSLVVGNDMAASNNSDETITVSDSHNTSTSETNTDMSTDTTVDDSFNETSDDDLIDVDVTASEVEVDAPAPAPTAVHEPDTLPPVAESDASAGLLHPTESAG